MAAGKPITNLTDAEVEASRVLQELEESIDQRDPSQYNLRLEIAKVYALLGK